MHVYDMNMWMDLVYNPSSSFLNAEDVGCSYAGTTKDIFDSYVRSRGHLAALVIPTTGEKSPRDNIAITIGETGEDVIYNKGEADLTPYSLTAATCSKNLLSTSDNKDTDVYHELAIGENELVYNFEQYN